jgi:hypothetical protein
MSIRSNRRARSFSSSARLSTEVLNYRIADSIRPPET